MSTAQLLIEISSELKEKEVRDEEFYSSKLGQRYKG